MSTSHFFSESRFPRRHGDTRSSTPPMDAPTGTNALIIRNEPSPARERSDSSDIPPPNSDSRKRASIDTSTAIPGDKQQLSPIKAAEKFIASHTASLRNEIATLLLERGHEHINLAHKVFEKYRNQQRMEADDKYIPVSARVEFRLQAVKEAEELPEFKQLQDQAATVIKEKQAALKQLVIETLKVEQTVLRNKLNKHFCESIFITTKLFLTAQRVDTAQCHNVVAHMLDQHGEMLLKHTGLEVEDFLHLYQATVQFGAVPLASTNAFNSLQIGSIKRAIESVFVLSWDRYLSQVRENDLSISLKKEVKERLTWQKTADATMEIENELPADRDQLRNLIQREAETTAKKLIRKAVEDAKLGPAKNAKRGHAAKGASDKKKKDSNRKQKEKKETNGKAKEDKTKSKKERKEKEKADKRKEPASKTETTQRNRNRSRSQSRTRRRNARKADDADSDSGDGASRPQAKRSKSRQRNRKRN